MRTAGSWPVNLYFDDSGVLVRTVRWSSMPVGTVPTQTDYSDYRDVAAPLRQIDTTQRSGKMYKL